MDKNDKENADYEKMWHEALRFVCELHGADYYYFEGALLLHSNIEPEKVILDGYPDGWRSHYHEHAFYKIDPAVEHRKFKLTPYVFPDQRNGDYGLTAEQQKMYADAQSFGIQSGICFPFRNVGAQYGMLHVASKLPYAKSPISQAAIQYEFYYIGAMLMDSHLEQRGKHIRALEESLTPREKDCLTWVVEGKTSEEIADIIGVTKRTVSFHLQNAMQKMGTYSRTSTAVKYALYSAR